MIKLAMNLVLSLALVGLAAPAFAGTSPAPSGPRLTGATPTLTLASDEKKDEKKDEKDHDKKDKKKKEKGGGW